MQNLMGIEIFAPGTWNGFKFGMEDLDEIARNTASLMGKRTHQPPVKAFKGFAKPPAKLGHTEDQRLLGQADGDPALGWLENIRVQGQRLLADLMNVPDILAQAIDKKLYRKVSVELKHVQHLGWFVDGLALLGADLPAVKTLDDLSKYLSEQDQPGQNPDLSGAALFLFSEPSITHEDNMEKDQQTPEQVALMSENETLKRQLLEIKEKDRVRAFAEAKAGTLKTFEDDVKSGKLAPALRDKVERFLDTQKATFTEGQEIALSASLVREITQGYAEGLPKGEQAKDNGKDQNGQTPDEVVVQKTLEFMEKSGLDYMQASERVLRIHPRLAEDYKKLSFTIAGMKEVA